MQRPLLFPGGRRECVAPLFLQCLEVGLVVGGRAAWGKASLASPLYEQGDGRASAVTGG